jgi:hypothetical protein
MSTRRQAVEGAVVWTGRCVCEDTRIWVVEVVVVVLAEEQTDSGTVSNLAKKSRGQVLAALSLAVKHLKLYCLQTPVRWPRSPVASFCCCSTSRAQSRQVDRDLLCAALVSRCGGFVEARGSSSSVRSGVTGRTAQGRTGAMQRCGTEPWSPALFEALAAAVDRP